MVEIVEVVRMNDELSVEVTCPTSGCKSCSGHMFCNVKGKTFSAEVDKDFEQINPGDKLKIYLPPGRTIFSSFVTLIFPLLLFPLFYIMLPNAGEGMRFLFSIFGVAVGFALAAIYFHYSKSKYYPKVIEKVN